MSIQKVERNKLLIEKRNSDPKKYSFGVLGTIFGISKITAYQIYTNESKKIIEKKKKTSSKTKRLKR